MEIIDLMIGQETDNLKPGYEDRLKGLNEIKNSYKILNSLTTLNKDEVLNVFFNDYKQTLNDFENKKSFCNIF